MGNRMEVNADGTLLPYTGHNSLNRYGPAEGETVTNGPQHEISNFKQVTYTNIGDTYLARASSSAPGVGTYSMGYDAPGRCVRRTTNGQITCVVYDGVRAIMEYNGSATASTLYGLGIGVSGCRSSGSMSSGRAPTSRSYAAL